MSSDLLWLLVKNNNSFLVKRDGTQFSGEKNNLTNLNSFKFSGLANKKTIGFQVKDSKIHFNQKRFENFESSYLFLLFLFSPFFKNFSANAASKPASALTSTVLSSHMIKGSCRSAETIKALTSGSHYRADLSNYAVARYHALYKSQKALKSGLKPKAKKTRGKKVVKA